MLRCGWRGRIRTFDLLIQSQVPESGLADAVLNVIRRSTALGFRVSQVPIRKRIRCPSENTDESGAPFEHRPDSSAGRPSSQLRARPQPLWSTGFALPTVARMVCSNA